MYTRIQDLLQKLSIKIRKNHRNFKPGYEIYELNIISVRHSIEQLVCKNQT